MYYYDTYYLLLLAVVVISFIVQGMVNSRFEKYSKVVTRTGMTGREVAEKILRDAGISDVSVKFAQGSGLSDHYDPMKRVLRLSERVINSNSVAAVSVAAHEASHALQHAENYKPLVLRTACVNSVNFGSRFSMLIIILGLFLSFTPLLYVGVALYSLVVFFALITLPVEFNASRRALSILSDTGVVSADELHGAKSVLSAAAMTYVVSALSAVIQLLRLVALANRAKDRD